MLLCVWPDCYDQTDAVPDGPALSTASVIESCLTETDNPALVPSYADFLIAYPTQSCELKLLSVF